MVRQRGFCVILNFVMLRFVFLLFCERGIYGFVKVFLMKKILKINFFLLKELRVSIVPNVEDFPEKSELCELLVSV